MDHRSGLHQRHPGQRRAHHRHGPASQPAGIHLREQHLHAADPQHQRVPAALNPCSHRSDPSDTMTPDPYAPYLRQADELFARGEIVKAGQIWQAILKQQPTHTEARERLVALRERLLAEREAQAAAALPPPAPQPAPEPEPAPAPVPEPLPPATPVVSSEEPDRLVIQGCTLYDMGQVPDALQK